MLASCLKAGLHVAPRNDVPEGLYIVALDVQIVEVEGVLPHVEHQNWDGRWCHVTLLVIELLDDQALAERIPGKECPT